MSVRVIDEQDVRRLLPMDECIEVMAGALASLARGEVHNPLRFVVRPPGEASLLGLMPAHRGGDRPLWGLKSVAIFPANAERGLDLHQGFVALFDGETGETRAIMNAGGITAVRTAAVSGVATRLLAREHGGTLAILGAGIQGKSHLEAMRAVRDFDRVRRLEPDARPGRRGARRRRGIGHGRRSGSRRRRHRDGDVGGRADPAARVAEAGRARQRRRLEHPDDARARHGDDARRVALRRPPRVDGQRGGRLL